MKLTELQMRIKIELEMYNNIGERVKPLLISEFEWAVDDNIAYIATPIHEGVIYPIHIGVLIDVNFICKGDLYKFEAIVLDRDTVDSVPVLKVQINSEIKRIQRRQFFRFECSVPVKYRVVSSISFPQNEEEPFKKSITRDLSGGGLCILLEDSINHDKLIECELILGGDKVIKFYGKVIRLTKFNTAGKFKYEIAVGFKKIENKDREAIIGYIFEEQRKLRKKGLI